jgi:hypothetical protein
MICLRANLDRSVERLDIQKFRKLIGVPADAYERGDNFMRFVLQPALLEVNGLSDVEVQINLERRHSRAPIEAVTMTWWKKSGDQYRAVIEERKLGKADRMARLKAKAQNSLTSPAEALYARGGRYGVQPTPAISFRRELPIGNDSPLST